MGAIVRPKSYFGYPGHQIPAVNSRWAIHWAINPELEVLKASRGCKPLSPKNSVRGRQGTWGRRQGTESSNNMNGLRRGELIDVRWHCIAAAYEGGDRMGGYSSLTCLNADCRQSSANTNEHST